ncbi:MAG: ribokinase [Lachnospiraceae bacterium]|nr:ribokinase [Lachnospiraceae bacterium]
MTEAGEIRIAVVGSLNMDYSVVLKKRPAVGETVLADDILITPGGKGANQAYAAGRTGGSVQMIGRVGSDANAEIVKNTLEGQNINTEGIREDKENPTGIAIIALDSQAQNSIIVCPGANQKVKGNEIIESLDKLANLKIIMLQLEIPMECVVQAINYAQKRNIMTFLDPAPVPPEGLTDSTYKMLDYISPNAIEAEMLSGIEVSDMESARSAARYFMGKGVKNVIIKLGGQGVYATDGTAEVMIPAIEMPVADTTAAGDTFAGAFCTRLEKGDSFFDAVRYANYAGGLSVTRKGAQKSMPSAEEIEKFIGLNEKKV